MSLFTLFSSLGLVCHLLEAQKLVMTEPGPSFINVFVHVIQLVVLLVRDKLEAQRACYNVNQRRVDINLVQVHVITSSLCF